MSIARIDYWRVSYSASHDAQGRDFQNIRANIVCSRPTDNPTSSYAKQLRHCCSHIVQLLGRRVCRKRMSPTNVLSMHSVPLKVRKFLTSQLLPQMLARIRGGMASLSTTTCVCSITTNSCQSSGTNKLIQVSWVSQQSLLDLLLNTHSQNNTSPKMSVREQDLIQS